jgi:hypothetical protein
MGVDITACVAYGVEFTMDEDIQKLLDLSDEEFEAICEGKEGYCFKCASFYEDAGGILCLSGSLIEIDRSDHKLIRPFEATNLEWEFWSEIGPELTMKIKKLNKYPSWLLMYRMT